MQDRVIAILFGPGRTVKDRVFNLVPAIMVATVVVFWAYGPKALLDNPWTLTAISAGVVLSVLAMELIHERHAAWRINRQELLTDLGYTVFNASVIGWLSSELAEKPLTELKASLGISTSWLAGMPWLIQVLMIFAIFEFGQYWMHRLMHNVTPFWLTHAPHHHVTQLNAAKGAVGNPIELFLISLSVLALLDFQPTALLASVSIGVVVSTFAHANVAANPPIWYSYFLTTISHHSLHHSTDYENTRCNYGNSLILFDRLLGTYRAGEGVLVGQGDRKRLSIWEQTAFPFQPLIDRYRARKASGDPNGPAATA